MTVYSTEEILNEIIRGDKYWLHSSKNKLIYLFKLTISMGF